MDDMRWYLTEFDILQCYWQAFIGLLKQGLK